MNSSPETLVLQVPLLKATHHLPHSHHYGLWSTYLCCTVRNTGSPRENQSSMPVKTMSTGPHGSSAEVHWRMIFFFFNSCISFPEFICTLNLFKTNKVYQITAGKYGKPWSFTLWLFPPQGSKNMKELCLVAEMEALSDLKYSKENKKLMAQV